MANSFLEMENIVPPHTTVLVKRIADGFKTLVSMEDDPSIPVFARQLRSM